MLDALQGAVLWLTGLPASGKTTLARGLVEAFRELGLAVLWLDSDDLRAVMTPQASYSPEERDIFYATLGHLARLGAAGGVTVLISATASRASYREQTRASVERFIEIFLTCSEEKLRERDFKGLYQRADAGEILSLPGAQSSYEVPADPELTLDSSTHTPAELREQTLAWLRAYQP